MFLLIIFIYKIRTRDLLKVPNLESLVQLVVDLRVKYKLICQHQFFQFLTKWFIFLENSRLSLIHLSIHAWVTLIQKNMIRSRYWNSASPIYICSIPVTFNFQSLKWFWLHVPNLSSVLYDSPYKQCAHLADKALKNV